MAIPVVPLSINMPSTGVSIDIRSVPFFLLSGNATCLYLDFELVTVTVTTYLCIKIYTHSHCDNFWVDLIQSSHILLATPSSATRIMAKAMLIVILSWPWVFVPLGLNLSQHIHTPGRSHLRSLAVAHLTWSVRLLATWHSTKRSNTRSSVRLLHQRPAFSTYV